MRSKYIHRRPLASTRHRQGRLLGRMEGFAFNLQQEAVLETLTADRLFGWHASLFRAGRKTGAWRDDSAGPMQVISGPIGRERVHYEAPAAARIDGEMHAFLQWSESDTPTDPVLKAGLAHLWFVTIHPFDDGNGRIARAIADLILARSENSPSVSTACRRKSARSATSTTASSSKHKKEPST